MHVPPQNVERTGRMGTSRTAVGETHVGRDLSGATLAVGDASARVVRRIQTALNLAQFVRVRNEMTRHAGGTHAAGVLITVVARYGCP